MEDEPLCPVCYTGVLQPMGDMADILQDVIFEEVDDFIAGEDRGFLKAHRPVAERKEAVVKTMDPQVEVMVYLECLQRLLKAQLDVIVKWFGSKAYEGVLKQIWKLVVLQSGLLNVGHLKAIDAALVSADEDSDDDNEAQAGTQKKRGKLQMSATSQNINSVLYTCNKKLSMLTMLSCHLLTAWTLKLPLWPRDILEAARDGDLPHIAAINLCEDLLEGHPIVRRALRTPFEAVATDAGLVAATHRLATNINVVIPELNLGAFVHRHCASLGLSGEIAALATHLALSRQVNTREHGMPEHIKRRVLSSWASAQFVQVFLPIMAICKHVLKLVSMSEDPAADLTADSMRPWVQAGQSLLELRMLKHQQRYQMAFHKSVDVMLDYTLYHSLHECKMPAALSKAWQSLQDYASDLEQQQTKACEREEEDSGLCKDVMVTSEDSGVIASQIYAQLVRMVAIEIGLDVTIVDVMAVQYYRDLLEE